MGKTQQQHYDDIYKKGLAAAGEQKTEREAADAQMLAQINAAIDKSADTTAGIYQKNIDAAPQKYQEAYDKNAVNEAFARKRVQESMANMGLTDSGYNITTQTALTLQRGNADAAVAAEQRDYVRKLEDAIDAVRADAEQQKKAQALSAEAERQKWWDNILADLRTSSSTAAADMYAADQEYAAKQAQAAADYASELNKQRESYALSLMKNMDYTEDQAWASAYARYPSGDEKDGLYYEAIRKGYSPSEATIYANAGGGEAATEELEDLIVTSAKTFVEGLDLDVNSWKTFWRNEKDDGEIVAETVLANLQDNPAYQKKSQYEQEAILEMAIAHTVMQNWDTNRSMNEKDNYARLKLACEKAGVDYNNVLAVYNKLNVKKKTNTKTDKQDVYSKTARYTDTPAAAAGTFIGNWISDQMRRQK